MICKRLYSSYSVCERGILYQLRNVINRTVKPNPKGNVNAANDFITMVTTCHILSAAMEILNMSELTSIPDSELVDENTWMSSLEERKEIFSSLCHKVVDTYTNFKFDWQSPLEPATDGVFTYAVELMSLGLFYLTFKDAVREGNGDQVIHCWKYFLPIFKASGHTNYSVELFSCFISTATLYHQDNHIN